MSDTPESVLALVDAFDKVCESVDAYGFTKEYDTFAAIFETLERYAELLEQHDTLRARVAELEAAKLDKPARITNGTFGVGVSQRLVIEAAQRYYEYTQKNPSPKPLFTLADMIGLIGLKVKVEELKDQIAAYEKVCAGTWVPVGERLPAQPVGDVHYVMCCRPQMRIKLYPQFFEVGRWYDCEGGQPAPTPTHWLDVKLPGEQHELRRLHAAIEWHQAMPGELGFQTTSTVAVNEIAAVSRTEPPTRLIDSVPVKTATPLPTIQQANSRSDVMASQAFAVPVCNDPVVVSSRHSKASPTATDSVEAH